MNKEMIIAQAKADKKRGLELDPLNPDDLENVMMEYGYDDEELAIYKDAYFGSKVKEAFSYEDDEFFTREEVDDFAEKVCEHINETFNEVFKVQESYITSNEIEVVVYNDELGEFTGKKKVDMRRIRKPSDLDKYVLDIAADIIEEIKEVLIDSDYHDADEDELRKMGVFDESLTEDSDNDWLKAEKEFADAEEEFLDAWEEAYQETVKAEGKTEADEIQQEYVNYKTSNPNIKASIEEWADDFGLTFDEAYTLIKEFSKKLSRESITEDSETTNSDLFGVFSTGGSIGSNDNNNLRAWNGNKSGQLVKVFHSSAEAQDYAKALRKSLSKGERSYYGMTYFIKKLSKKDREHPQVIKLMNESVIKESPEDDGPYSYKETEAELQSLTQNWTREKDQLKCGYDEEKNYGMEILSKHGYECNADKQGGWWIVDYWKDLDSDKKGVRFGKAKKAVDFDPITYDEDVFKPGLIVEFAEDVMYGDAEIVAESELDKYPVTDAEVEEFITKHGFKMSTEDEGMFYIPRGTRAKFIGQFNAGPSWPMFEINGVELEFAGDEPFKVIIVDDSITEATTMRHSWYGSRYTDYNKEDGWTDEDIAKHKEIDWQERNYHDYPIPEDSFTGEAIAHTDNGTKRARVKFIKYIRSNPIFPPYYAPENNPFTDVVGPMYNGNKHGSYGIHDMYESQDIYDTQSH